MDVEYSFGTGTGEPVVWSSEADFELGDGGPADAVRLDFDGDGLRDDAMWDADRDGVAELAALDLDDDGTVERFYADPDGRGVWQREVPRPTPAVPDADLVWTDRQGHMRHAAVTGESGITKVDFDADGRNDDAVFDGDRDGRVDGVLIGSGHADGYSALLTSPTLAVVDRNADGRLDGVSRAGEPGFVG